MTAENDDIDVTEEKAKAIGKVMEVEEDTPEYDIIEEKDDDTLASKSRETKEEKEEREKQLSKSQEKRQRRKQKLDSVIGGKDAIIEAQARKLEELERRMMDVDNRFSGLNKAEIEKQWRDNGALADRARQEYVEATNEGDGLKQIAALETLKRADDRGRELQGLYNHATAVRQELPPTDAIVVNKANAWAKENLWYSAHGNDTDSVVAKAIAGALVKEGYDPKSDDYWDELSERVAARVPHAAQVDEDEEYDEEAPKARKVRTPPVSGGAKRADTGGKRTITLPTSYIEKMKREVPEIWNNPQRRAKLLADRERIMRENG